jgi:hypothetical protein
MISQIIADRGLGPNIPAQKNHHGAWWRKKKCEHWLAGGAPSSPWGLRPILLVAASGGALTIDNHHPLLFPGFYRLLKMIIYFLYIQGKRTILQLNFSFINDWYGLQIINRFFMRIKKLKFMMLTYQNVSNF